MGPDPRPRLVVGVARNDGKGPLFTTDERVEMVRNEIAQHSDRDLARRIEVKPCGELLMNFAMAEGAKVIVANILASDAAPRSGD